MVFLDEAITNILNDKTLANAGDSFVNAFHQGQQIAAQQQQMKINKIKIDQAGQELESKQDDREMEFLRHISNKDTVPAARKGLIQAYSDFRESRGKKTNPDLLNMFSQDEGLQEAFNDSYAKIKFPNDEFAQEAAKYHLGVITKAVGGNTLDGVKMFEDARKFPEQREKMDELVTGKIKAATTAAALSGKGVIYQDEDLGRLTEAFVNNGIPPAFAATRAQALIRSSQMSANEKQSVTDKNQAITEATKTKSLYLTDIDDVKSYNGDNGPAAQKLAVRMNEELAAKAKTAKDAVDLAAKKATTANTEAKTENEKLKPSQFQQRMAAVRDRMSVQWSRLSLAQKSLKDRSTSRIENDTSLKGIEQLRVGAEKGLQLLSGDNVNWVNFKESNIDLAGLAALRPSAVIPAYRERGLDPSMAAKDIDKVRTWFSGSLKGGPDETLKQQMKETFARLGVTVNRAFNVRYNNLLQDRERNGIFSRSEAQGFFNDGKMEGSDSYSPPSGTPGGGAGTGKSYAPQSNPLGAEPIDPKYPRLVPGKSWNINGVIMDSSRAVQMLNSAKDPAGSYKKFFGGGK